MLLSKTACRLLLALNLVRCVVRRLMLKSPCLSRLTRRNLWTTLLALARPLPVWPHWWVPGVHTSCAFALEWLPWCLGWDVFFSGLPHSAAWRGCGHGKRVTPCKARNNPATPARRPLELQKIKHSNIHAHIIRPIVD